MVYRVSSRGTEYLCSKVELEIDCIRMFKTFMISGDQWLYYYSYSVSDIDMICIEKEKKAEYNERLKKVFNEYH
jgi:hypothetical protein